MRPDTDIAIIGGGPVGAALALALGENKDSDARVTVLEARAADGYGADNPPPGSLPIRPIALSHASRLLLERLGVWSALTAAATPAAIQHIHVSQRGGFGRLALNAADAGVPGLGYVFDFKVISVVMGNAARTGCYDYRAGARATALSREGSLLRINYARNGAAETLTARLVVIADGGEIEGLAPPKITDYGQHALTALVRTSLPHGHVAYERFTPEGPLALLPFCGSGNNSSNAMALVWTLKPERAEALLHADDATFLAALRESFGGRLGEFTGVSRRAAYPLSLRQAAAHNGMAGVVAIGNAAQTLHPVAGQGFNLGLRDAWELARLLRTIPVQSPNACETWSRYRAERRIDRTATIAATHGLVRLFSNDFFPLRAARGIGLTLVGSVAPARDFFARRMIFGARG